MGAPDAMSTRWHIGAKHLRGAIAAYAKRFDLLEVRASQPAPGESSDAAPGPSLATLRRWRKSVPPHFDFAVVAGPHLSRVKASDGGRAGARGRARRHRRAAGALLRPAHAAGRDAHVALARAHRARSSAASRTT